MKKQVIIHVGLPKTASTYLQTEFFPFLKDVNFYYRNLKIQSNPITECLKKLRDNSLIDPIDPVCEKNKINEYINIIQESKILISDEIFSIKDEYYTSYFKQIFPEAQIILCIREQTDWLESFYKQHITSGNTNIVIDYFLQLNAFNCNWLDRYNHYVNNFGKDNVLVLPYEMLKKDNDQFLKKFFDFTDIEYFCPENKTIRPASSFSSLILKSFINTTTEQNKLVNFLINCFDKFIKINGNFIDKKRKRLIKNYYNNYNKKLSEHIDINLKNYGYISEQLILGNINFQKNIDKLVKKYKNKKILIYGAGKFFTDIAENCNLSKLNIIGISDKKFHKSEINEFIGYKAIDPSEIHNYDFDVIILGIMTEVQTVKSIKGFLENLLGANKFKLDFINNYTLWERIKILILESL